jgi:hypothetical protein
MNVQDHHTQFCDINLKSATVLRSYLPADYAYFFTKESFKSRAYNNLHANLTCLHFFNYLISLNFLLIFLQ